MIRSLYLHVPFCERKCEYCDFTSIAGTRGEAEYMAALGAEVRLLGDALPEARLDTIFIGGGTPSLLEPRRIADLLQTVARSFRLDAGVEISMEANPSSVSLQRARSWRAAGVTRLSLGVQSLHAPTLRFLGRVHDAGRALAAVAEVQAAGFELVNCDLIYAVPELTTARWRDTLRRVIAAGPGHVSCYELTVESGTPLQRRVARGEVLPAGDSTALRQHDVARELLAAHGFEQYEVSSFARPGQRCRHNLAYWRNRYYAAAGVGAHGHLPARAAASLGLAVDPGAVAVRYWHGRGIGAYAAALAEGRLPVAGHESIDVATRLRESLMLGLRLRDGVALPAAARAEARSLEAAGLLLREGRRSRATARGERLLNAVTERLVAAVAA